MKQVTEIERRKERTGERVTAQLGILILCMSESVQSS